MTPMATAVVVQAVPLLIAALLLARTARGQPQRRWWMAAAWVLALVGAARLLAWDPRLDGAFAAALALGVFACVAAVASLAAQWQAAAAQAAVRKEELTRSEQRYRFLLNRLPEAFVVLEGDRIAFVNRAFGRIFGIEPEAARGRQLDQLIAPEWRDAYHRRHSLESTTPSVGMRRLEVEILTSEGERVWVEMRFATSSLEDHPAEVALIADISERRRAQLRLERFTATMLGLDGDYDANVQRLTAVCGEMLGASCALYNRLRGDFLCTLGGWQLPVDYQKMDRAEGHLCFDVIRRGAAAGPLLVEDLSQTGYAESDPNVRRLGLTTYAGFPVSSRGRTVGSICVVFKERTILTNDDLRVLQMVAGALGLEEERHYGQEVQRAGFEIAEVTHRAEDLTALFASVHATVMRLMDATDFSVALLDRETQELSFPFVANQPAPPKPHPAARGLVEYTLRVGRAVRVSPEVFADLVALGEIAEAKLGCEAWLGVPLEDRAGPFGVMVVESHRQGYRFTPQEEEVLTILASQVARAVEHLRAEERLRQSERKYRTLVDRMQDGMFLLQGKRVVFCNEAFGRIVGRPASELEDSEFLPLIAPEDREMVLERYRRRQAGESVPGEYEFRLLHADGRRRIDVLMHVGVIDYQGRPATLGTVRDLSERKRLEAQLRQAQRIEALGQLAGGVAHDFNNLLMAIQGSAQLVRKRLSEGPREEIDTILAASRRASLLTRGLLAFAQRQVLEPQPLDLNRHIHQTLPILRRIIPENIGIDFEPSASPLVVEVDAGQLDQILINLAVNSRDAMEDGGRILLRTAAVEIDQSYRDTHPWAKLGPHALLQVCDTGAGMDAETLAHIFEPFFTTKALGRGTGLGLSTVYGIIKQHGGMVDVASEVGKGTIVDVYFPAVDKPPMEEPQRNGVDLSGGGERILVVEDEAEVRQILVEALREAGYQVHEAADGAEALDFLVRSGKNVDLVLSDVVMPRMGGKELLDATRAHGLKAPFLFSSGYGQPFIHRPSDPGEHVAFIAKPYGIDELLRKVREVMASAGDCRA